jgi:hypothetical protein
MQIKVLIGSLYLKAIWEIFFLNTKYARSKLWKIKFLK